ncbi:DUF1934 domain-containing protein [Paenisporosarcina antarctica]|uniref:DUF1934 domain-containing protein n=1 Tax=Paenisporosarcina antarctica TaxID=417367 RepID=A0A4P7A0L7_9BACL|nr:DUF1934 domain-containing protein [Paenisporosarcina antarctica]QBP42138.1 DUF1934 domain-containing protein [Paenisporosarcina antarctica]
MNKQVKVKLKTTIQQPNEQPEIYELWVTGTYIEKGESAYLKYEEVQDDKNIKTIVKMGETEALILRSGGINMRLPLVKETEQTGSYESEYGVLMVKTMTRKIMFEKNKQDGQFIVQYDLNVSGQSVGEYTLEFHYMEESQ